MIIYIIKIILLRWADDGGAHVWLQCVKNTVRRERLVVSKKCILN
jgi:hypothetical protein